MRPTLVAHLVSGYAPRPLPGDLLLALNQRHALLMVARLRQGVDIPTGVSLTAS